METFRWISVVISIILGLGVARLLTSAVIVFRARGRGVVDWVPLVWAGAIFIQQIAFWWSLEEAAVHLPTWTLGAFSTLVLLMLALFVAAALALPGSEFGPGETLRTYFERDGRWALIALALFNLVVIFTNWMIWGAGPLSEAVRINVALTVVPVAGFLGSRGGVHAVAALAYMVITVWGVVDLAPAAYEREPLSIERGP